MHDPNTISTEVEETMDTQSVVVESRSGTSSARQAPAFPGLKIARRFTEPGEDVWNTVEWEKRSAVITGEKGDIVFEQYDTAGPKTWTQLAKNFVASKHFRGHLGPPERERSCRPVHHAVRYTL